MQELINRDSFGLRLTPGNELRTQQLERKSERREQHQYGVNHTGVPELVRTQLVSDGEVVEQVHDSDEDGAEQHDGAAAQNTKPEIVNLVAPLLALRVRRGN